MSKKPAIDFPDFAPTSPPETEVAPVPETPLDPEPTFLPGYRSALDNPAHPLHHLKDA